MTKDILPEDQQVLETNNKELLCQNRCKYTFQDLANIQRQKEDNEVECRIISGMLFCETCGHTIDMEFDEHATETP